MPSLPPVTLLGCPDFVDESPQPAVRHFTGVPISAPWKYYVIELKLIREHERRVRSTMMKNIVHVFAAGKCIRSVYWLGLNATRQTSGRQKTFHFRRVLRLTEAKGTEPNIHSPSELQEHPLKIFDQFYAFLQAHRVINFLLRTHLNAKVSRSDRM